MLRSAKRVAADRDSGIIPAKRRADGMRASAGAPLPGRAAGARDALLYCSKAKIRFQSFLMLMTIQPSFFASS